MKVLLVVIALSAGVLGGSFAPSLFIGTALGAAVGHLAQSLFPSMGIDPKAYAIIGMGAFFAGLLRSPIAAVLIVIEVTRDYDLVLPLMLGVSLAVAISRRTRGVRALSARRRISQPVRHSPHAHAQRGGGER